MVGLEVIGWFYINVYDVGEAHANGLESDRVVPPPMIELGDRRGSTGAGYVDRRVGWGRRNY